MNFKTIGIVGGMGPAAGGKMFDLLLKYNVKAKCDADYPSIIHFSNSKIPNRVDFFFKKGPSPIPELVSTCEKLYEVGADIGVMACNNANLIFDQIQAKTKLKLFNIIEYTALFLVEQHIQRVGILASEPILKLNGYRDILTKNNIELVVLDNIQNFVNQAIYNPNHGIKAQSCPVDGKAKQLLETAVKFYLDKDINHIINGCTEISLVYDHGLEKGVFHVDPMDITAIALLKAAGVSGVS